MGFSTLRGVRGCVKARVLMNSIPSAYVRCVCRLFRPVVVNSERNSRFSIHSFGSILGGDLAWEIQEHRDGNRVAHSRARSFVRNVDLAQLLTSGRTYYTFGRTRTGTDRLVPTQRREERNDHAEKFAVLQE